MISMTCHNIELGRTRLEVVACGCYSNASFDRFSAKNSTKGMLRNIHGGCKARKLKCFHSDASRCHVVSTKTPETLLNGADANTPSVFELKRESMSLSSLKSLFEVVGDDLKTLNKNLKSIVGAENPVLMSAAEQIFGAGGKRMRPALVFLVSRATAQLAGLEELTKEHRRLAEIIEMIHTASLIHDDVIDESDMRRGKETVHQIYGTRVAVLAGDFMFAQSSWYLANLENLEVIKLISQVIKDFASGEIKQASSLFDCDVELDEYMIKSYYKTASLIAASAKGAAIFSGVGSDVNEQMYQYGKNLGLSFQVVDDILDFTQSAEQLGKPTGSDLAKGNLTAPVIYALENESKLRDIIESEFTETGSLEEAINMVKSSGGIEMAQELAKEKADEAIQNLQCLPSSPYRLALEEMVRDHSTQVGSYGESPILEPLPKVRRYERICESMEEFCKRSPFSIFPPHQIPVYGPSMLPTLNLTGDVLLVEHMSPLMKKVGPGDIVIVRSPDNPKKIITKRILAMEGDSVSFLIDPAHSDRSLSVVVPRGHVWVQGDNIYSSRDSRQLGPIPYGLILGKVFWRVWPPDGFGSLGAAN